MKQFYRYYQTSEHSQWELVTDHEEVHKELAQKGAVRIGFLALDKVVDAETDAETISYKGDFYADIDSKDLQHSIESAQTFLAHLDAIGVPASSYEIYVSGSKGFHFYLHHRLYSDGRPSRRLPQILKAMAMRLHVDGLDYQPYCGGRGNLCRLPDVQRADGHYKVRIYPDELKAMTPAWYQTLASQPRVNVAFTKMRPPTSLNPILTSYFNWAKEFDNQVAKRRTDLCIADAHLAQFQLIGPQCIEDLVSGYTKAGKTFNQAAMQLAIFLARSTAPINVQNSYIDRAATNLQSSSYASFNSRRQHLQAQLKYHESRPDIQFLCPALRSLVSTSPCKGCPIEGVTTIKDEYEVIERPDGYYAVSSKEERRLTSFTIFPLSTIEKRDPDTDKTTRVMVTARIESNHESLGVVRMEEACWSSRGSLVRAVEGISNLKVTASDNDIQNIKHFVLRDLDTSDKQFIVGSLGVHRDLVNKKPRYTWVEQDMSVNKFHIQNTHILQSSVNSKHAAMPRFDLVTLPKANDPGIYQALQNLFQLNLPEVVAPILGWYCACHLKSQLIGMYSQFPLLSLWGGRGSGKTRTASVFALLNGADYETYPAPTLTSVTDFALMQTLCSTTTVPRVLDEFNRSGMTRRNRYNQIGELLKMSFNNAPMPRGRIAARGESSSGGIGAVADYYYLTAPICVLSEHAIDIPALVDRAYKVMLAEPAIKTRTAHMEYLQEHTESLVQLAFLMVVMSLNTRDEWVKDRLNSWKTVVPKDYSIRQNYVRQVIGLGLDFLDHVLSSALKINLRAELDLLRHAYMARILDVRGEVEISGFSTEIDMFMERLGELWSLITDGTMTNSLNGRHLQVKNGYLFLDIPPVFAHLQQYMTSIRERKPISTAKQWLLLLRSEPYYSGMATVREMTITRSVVKLSLEEMEKKGIDISQFH